MAKNKKQKKSIKLADLADRHKLYEASVQNVEFETEFVATTFKQLRGRPARQIREDFCGTANAACAWVRRHKHNTAIGIDLDASVLAWGRQHHIAELKAHQAARISLLQQDVLTVLTPPVDAILAMNFSYWCFRTRPLLLEYFRVVHAAMIADGVFFLDAYGGYEAHEELEEATEYDDFTYTWEQAEYDPMSGYMKTHIHFDFPDGSAIRPAFTYEWRLWSLPEIRELLVEAGFQQITVYAQGWDARKEEYTDDFIPVNRLDADPGWVVCIVAAK